MTKKSGTRTKPEKGKAKPKKNGKGRTKRSAAELTDEQRQALLLSHTAKVERLLIPLEEAQTEVRAAYELAKKEGVTKKQIDFAISLKTEDGIERAKAARANEDFVARALNVPIGSQLDFFGKQSAKEKAFAEGKIAAMSDQEGKPPKQLHTNMHQAWLAGFAEGRTTLNVQRAESGFKPLANTVAAIAHKAGALSSDPSPEAHAH